MKKITFTFIFVFIIANVYSQNLAALDSKNGFRKFILGSPKENYKNLVESENKSSKKLNLKAYSYKGNDIKTVYNIEVQDITLFFFKNKLSGIQCTFGKKGKEFNKSDFDELYDALLVSYGSTAKTPTNDSGNILNGYIWKGKKVTLEMFRIDFAKNKLNRDENDIIIGCINVYDNYLQTQIYKSEF